MTYSRELIEKLREQPFTISWYQYRQTLIDSGASASQILTIKDAFYAGGAMAFFQFDIALGESRAAAKKRLNKLYDEIDEHMKNIANSPPSDAMRH